MAEVAGQLLTVLNSIDKPPQFCVSGSVAPVLPGLEVEGVGAVGVPVSPAVARQFIEQASQAPYGRGEETLVDTDVRRVWQIEPGKIALHNPEWGSLVEGVIDKVKAEFGIKGRVTGDLYKLLIYEEGSFFAPHRDTEKVGGMFATLVVGLPSRHEGGTLTVRHAGQSREVDFGGAQAEYKVQYAAFYADCRHEIKPVTQGYRVCLVYNLALARAGRQPGAPRHGEKVEAVAGLLGQLFAGGARQKVAIPLKHQYSEAGLSLDMLKGADRSRVDVLMRAAGQAKYHAYLCLMTYRQEGGVDEETAWYGRSGEIDESSAEMGEVYDEELTLDHWLDAEGGQQAFGKMGLGEDEILSETGFEDFPIKEQVHEATGNEGATVERWYRQAVVVVWPPDRYFGILARQGQDSAIPALEKLLAGAEDPSGDEGCRTLAREIIRRWKAPPHGRRGETPKHAPLLPLLERIGDPELVNQYVREVLPRDYGGTEGEALSRLADRLGWDTFAEGLTRFVVAQEPGSERAGLVEAVSIFEGLCCGPGGMNPRRKAVCRAVAAKLEQTLRRWDTEADPHSWLRKSQGRAGVLESLTRALSAIDEGDRLERVLAHALADKGHYGLHAVLIPAVRGMYGWATKEPVVAECRQQVLNHCVAELERLTAKPVEEPTDWAQDVTLRCQCADCRELQQFLRDPQEKVHRFRAAEARRRHLDLQMGGGDVSRVTERKGSPHTLVCTKNRASYDKRKAEFAANVELLAELRGLVRPKRKK